MAAVSSPLLAVLLANLAIVVLAHSRDMFAPKSATARAINAGYWIASLAIMIGFQAIFQAPKAFGGLWPISKVIAGAP